MKRTPALHVGKTVGNVSVASFLRLSLRGRRSGDDEAAKGAAVRGRVPPLAQQQRECVARTRAVRTGNPSCCLLTSHMAPLLAPFNPEDTPHADVTARYANKLPSESHQDAVIRLWGGAGVVTTGRSGPRQQQNQESSWIGWIQSDPRSDI